MEVLRLAETGVPPSEIAKKYNIPVSYIYRWRKGTLDARVEEEVLRTLSHPRMSPQQIAEDLEVSRGLVEREVSRLESKNIDRDRRPFHDQVRKMILQHPAILQTPEIIQALTPREAQVLTLYWGAGETHPISRDHIASLFNVTSARIGQIISKGSRKLYGRRRALEKITERDRESDGDSVDELPLEIRDVVTAVRALTPELMRHLKAFSDDITKLPPRIFEEVVGELFARYGYRIALVGTNPATSADIIAVSKPDALGINQRYFVEIKRWREKIGVQVIDQVFGAVLSEREVFGWTGAIIVSSVGFRQFYKYSRTQLLTKGIHLRDRDDLLRWLADYEPHKSGLWLPRRKLATTGPSRIIGAR